MTAKQKMKSEQEMLQRVVERMARITPEEWQARLDAYAREEDNPPWVTLGPGSGSVFISKNGSKPHRESNKP
jgi:hypothetical protein